MEVNASATKIRLNAAGNLLELKSQAATTHVCSSLAQKIEESAKIEIWTDETTFELRDLDEFTIKQGCETLKENLDADIDVLALKIIRRVCRGTQTAVVRLRVDISRKALEKLQMLLGFGSRSPRLQRA